MMLETQKKLKEAQEKMQQVQESCCKLCCGSCGARQRTSNQYELKSNKLLELLCVEDSDCRCPRACLDDGPAAAR